MFNSRVDTVDPNTGKIKLRDGTIMQGDLIICADGLGSLARGYLDYSTYDIATCLQSQCTLPESIEQEYLYLDIIGEGFAWAFPKKEYLNVGIGLPNSSKAVGLLKELLDRHMERLQTKPLAKINRALVSIGGPISSFAIGKLIVAGEAAGCVMPLSGEGIRFGIYGGSIAYRPDYRSRFMTKYGNKMKNSRKMLLAIEMLSDRERIDLLKRLEDPLRTLEGELPSIARLLGNPKLLMKLAQIYVK
jgi:digeranylgeranylglycerophospholipid reductase